MFRLKLLPSAATVTALGVLANVPTHAQVAPTDENAIAQKRTDGDIIVTGNRFATTARQEQRATTALVDIQSAETIAKYPDINAAEALSRVPGVFLDTDEAEGRFVNIRAIDGNLNGATFGGAVLLNTNPGATQFNGTGRAVLFNTIPTGAIDRIVVTKSWTPDHEAEGIGGSVELTPRSALSHPGFFVEGRLGGGFESQAKTPIFNDEIAIGDSFGRNRQGDRLVHVVVAQSRHDDKRGFDDIEAAYANSPGIVGGKAPEDKVYNSLELRRYRYRRQRYGYSADVEVTPGSNNLLFVRGSLAGVDELTNRQRLTFNNLDGTGSADAGGNPATGTIGTDPLNPSGFVAIQASVDNTLRDRKEYNRNLIVQGGGKHRLGEVTVDWLVSYIRASFYNPYEVNTTFTGPRGLTVRYDNITKPSFPTATVSGTNIADPALYRLNDIQATDEYSADRELSYHLNASAPLHLVANDQVKVGGELRYRRKYDVTNGSSLSFPDPVTGFGGGPSLTTLLGRGPATDYYGGLYNIGYAANAAAIASAYYGPLAIPALDIHDPGALVFDDVENIAAGYVQYAGELGALHFLTGVRVEHTKQILGGFSSQTTVDPATNAAVTTKTYLAPTRSYTNVFPSVHLIYQPTRDLQLRGSYSTSIARPGFFQTASRQTVDIANLVINSGNPDLRPSYASNFDVGAYYYLPGSGILSVSLFYKTITDFVVARTVTAPRTINGSTANYRIVTYSNVAGTYARGVEANYVQKFAQLPGVLSGVGIDLNALYTGSKVNLKDGLPGQSIPGTAAFSANAALFYEAHSLDLRLALNHNSTTLYSIGGSPTIFPYTSIPTDVYEAPRTTLDMTGRYDVTRSVSIYASIKNLTDAPLYSYEGRPDRPIRREYYGQTYEAGVQLRF